MAKDPVDNDERFVVDSATMADAKVERFAGYHRAAPELELDVYLPPHDGGEPWPTVIFVHGDAQPERLAGVLDWPQYRGWGRLTTTAGLAAVIPRHRSTRDGGPGAVLADIDGAVQWVEGDDRFDRSRLALWSCSLGVPFALRLLGRDPGRFRVGAALYGPCPAVGDGITLPPTVVVRCGRDRPELNESIDGFAAAATARRQPVTVLRHDTGGHAFDTGERTPESRRTVLGVLRFLEEHLIDG